jgi:hypothetical protein
MKNFILLTLVLLPLAACATNKLTAQSTVITTTTPSPLPISPSITPSQTPSAIPIPTKTFTASPEPDIAPNCNIVNKAEQIYLLSDNKYHNLLAFTGTRKLDQALAIHYPEWSNYRQTVSWSDQPVTMGEIMNSASINIELNLQINPAVTLVTLGERLDWQLPSNTDLYLKARETSLELNRSSIDWELPQNESLRSQYPQVANSGTYALYIFFHSDLDSLESWCNRYQMLFGTPP